MEWTVKWIAAPLLASTCALAAYPERPIRIIVPFTAGGNVDLAARTITPGLSDLLGRAVVVDNRGGAGGAVGGEIVAAATPDGYTLLVGSTGLLSIAPLSGVTLKFDPERDFTAVALMSDVPLVMLVNSASAAKSVKDFIALAKSSKSGLTMASSGNFSTGQLAGALFQNVIGVRMVHVPYKGASPAIADLMGGHVDVMFDQISSALGHIRGGRLRALAVTARSRAAELPELPTMAEAGVRGVEAGTFTALLAPARTPTAIVTRLNEAVNQVLSAKTTRDAFARQGAMVVPATPQATRTYIADELAKWRRVVREAGIRPDTQ